MRRVAASALVAVMSGSVLFGLAGPSSAVAPSTAAVPASPVGPIVQVVETALGEVDTLLCELFGNSVLCGSV